MKTAASEVLAGNIIIMVIRRESLCVLLFAACTFVLPSVMCSCGSPKVAQQTANIKVEQIRVAQDGSRLVKVWGVGGNADKAIVAAMRNAVENCLFTGIQPTATAGAIPPLCPNGYQDNKRYFDRFFANGTYQQYVVRANSLYPTGQDNVKVRGGRQVGIQVQLLVNQLRKRLEADGVIKSLDNIWDVNR